mmetsp:Transcript_50886/g.105941  ORF Transcript_50886/g.105941 Transcript_50886/m.105941 type:complete len:459 (-) Transcript_50886:54-1430(-)
MFVACPGPRWPAATPCGLTARGQAGRSQVTMQAEPRGRWGISDTIMKLVTSGIGVLGLREFVLRRIPAKLLPLRTLTQAVEDAAQGMTDEVSGMRIPVRPQQQDVRAFLDMPGPRAMQVPAFIVISGPQGIGKSAMLKGLLAHRRQQGKWVLPILRTLQPGDKLELAAIVEEVLLADRVPEIFPQLRLPFVQLMRQLNSRCLKKTGHPLTIYMQLSTQNRADDFDQNQCEAIAAAVGGFARELTYEYALCKFVLEVSVSLIADKIQDKFNMSELVVVDPLPLKSFVELALEIPEIAGNLKMDERSRAEILKYFYLRAGGSFRELQLLLKNAAKANASDAQGIKGRIDKWYRKKIQPIKDVLAETEEDEFQQFIRRLLGQKPASKYLDYVTKVAEAGPNGYLSGGDDKDTKLQMELRRMQPKQAILRSTTSTQVALRHWYFVFYVLGETEEGLQDAGYM